MMKFVCPHCNQEVEVEVPASMRRGALAGLSLSEMTDEQLKKEIVNAKSVLYKAEKRGASEEIIARNKERVDAALAEKARRKELAKEAKAEETTEAATEEAPATEETTEESVYNTEA